MKNSSSFNRVLVCGAVLALISCPFTTKAALEEIIVTAQKREQSINEVGITVSAFTAESLTNYGVRSAEDLEALVPGLTISHAAPNGVPVYTIRGVGFADYTTSASSTVGLYMDEVAIPYAVMSRGILFDIDRVEVLKGPQGDLYGRNTTAGQIHFISRKPTDQFEVGISLDYGRFEVLDVEGYVSGPLTSSARGRLAVKTVQSDEGWQQSLSRPGDKLGEKDSFAIRGLLEFDLNADASLLLNLRYSQDKSDNVAPTPFEPSPFAAFFFGGPDPRAILSESHRKADWPETHRPVNDNSLFGITSKLDWQIGNFMVTSITGYDEFERDDRFETSGVAYRDGVVRDVSDISSVSQEIRISSNIGPSLYWLAGVYYSTDSMDEAYLFTFDESPFAVNVDTIYEQGTESIAGFGHVEWSFAEQLKLTLGARYTEEDRKWSGCTFDNGDGSLAGLWNFLLVPGAPQFGIPSLADLGFPNAGVVPPGGCGILNDIPDTPNFSEFVPFSDKIHTSEWMWKASLDYRPTDDILLYGTISRGFKSGGFNGAAAQTHSQLIPYGEEKLMAYELGVKSTWLDGNLQLNASVFFYDYADKQEPTIAVTPVGNISGLTNVPESEIFGAEVELKWQAIKGLFVEVGVAYLDTEIKEYQAISPDSFFGNVIIIDGSGFELANSPNLQATASVTYDWSLTDNINAFVGGDMSYKDDNRGSTQPLIPSYHLYNARLGIRDAAGRWRVSVWGRNLTNDDYWYASVPSNGVNGRMYGMPLTYGVNLSYRY
jgi:iron complex outermembrane receptor protein